MRNRQILWWLAFFVAGASVLSLPDALGQCAEPDGRKTPPFERTWESLRQYECPTWFRDAKFGIYAHWGPYAVPPFPTTTDWYSHYMYQPQHRIHKFHVSTYGPVSKFGYKDLVPQFTAKGFDANAWAELYAEAGARFAGPVAEHSDGFALWDSALTEWDAMDKGPNRDIVGELEEAIRRRGLKFLTSFHHHWKWGWYATSIRDADCLDPRFAGLYGPALPEEAWAGKDEKGRISLMDVTVMPDEAFCCEWLGKVKEVVDRYHPDLLWFDNRMHLIPESYRIEMAAYFYNQAAARNQTVVINYKMEDLVRGTAVLDLERSRMPDIYTDPWLTDASIARNSWSYCPELDYYSTTSLVHDLVDIVSKNGCLLLNIAPHPDGTIPPEQIQRLRGIGDWLRLNGEAIYSTRPWVTFGEGPTRTLEGHLADLKFTGFTADDIRFTQTKDGSIIYVIVLGWPNNRLLNIRSLGRVSGKVADVSLVGYSTELSWTQGEDGLRVSLPDKAPGKHAFVFRVTGEGLAQPRD